MIAKAFEVRDRHTFIPVLGVLMVPPEVPSYGLPPVHLEIAERERYLLRRAGYNLADRLVMLVRMNASGCAQEAACDCYDWSSSARTMQVAHKFIQENWDNLQSGAVICVEHILGERATPKPSEREGG